MENYRKISRKPRDGELQNKKVEKVISGSAKTKKKNEVHRLADIFISEDATNVKSYIFQDVIIPTIKDTILEAIRMAFYGGYGGVSRKATGSNSGRTSYGRYYDKRGRANDYEREEPRIRRGIDYDDVILDSRGEAEEVLAHMDELINEYGSVSIADLYDLVGITSNNYTNNKYGWTDIRTSQSVRVRDGYALKMPKVLPLEH